MKLSFQYFAPTRLLAKIASLCANCQIPWIKNYLIRYFLSRYNVNLAEAVEKNPFAYKSFNDFFTRHLQANSRPIDASPNTIVSPADGTLSQWGDIKAGMLIQAKGHDFKIEELLGTSYPPFQEGHYMTLYLAPHDYHRVHMPLQGVLTDMHYIPGRLFSVNPKTADSIPHLFSRNERVVSYFDTAIGKMAIVMVGAMIVGNIEIVWQHNINQKRTKSTQFWHYEQGRVLEKGEEMGCFKLGSTVIIVFEKQTVSWDQNLTLLQSLQFGQSIGHIKTAAPQSLSNVL